MGKETKNEATVGKRRTEEWCEAGKRFGKTTDELVFLTADVGDIHVVGGGTDILLFGAFISILAIAWTAIRTNFLPVKICTNIST